MTEGRATRAEAAPPAPRRRGRPPTGVREAVLAATEEILAESGVARLSTKEVARRAAVAESSVFYHFGDRLGLLRAVVQAQLTPVRQVLGEVHGRAGTGTLRSDLVALLDALEGFFLRTMPVAAAIQSDRELREAFAEQSASADLGPHRAVDAVLGFLAEERAQGRLPAHVDLSATALLLVGAAHQRALQRRLSPPAATARLAGTGHVVDALMPALRPHNGTGEPAAPG